MERGTSGIILTAAFRKASAGGVERRTEGGSKEKVRGEEKKMKEEKTFGNGRRKERSRKEGQMQAKKRGKEGGNRSRMSGSTETKHQLQFLTKTQNVT